MSSKFAAFVGRDRSSALGVVLHESRLLLIVLCAGPLLGCLPDAEAPVAAPPTSRQDRLLVYDAGEVLAGQPIRHSFVFRNPAGETISIQDDSDIQTSCGCSQVDVIGRRLRPGEETRVNVEITSDHKRGEVFEVVTTQWALPHGDPLEYGFAIRAKIQSALVLKPAELSFSRDEVARGVSKSVVCESDLPIDWATTRIENHASELQITRQPLSNSCACFHVQCHRSGNGQAGQSTIEVIASGIRGPSPKASRYTTKLPVYWLSPADLTVSPSFVTLREHAAGWRASFVLTGDAIKSGARVESIASPLEGVRFQARKLGRAAERVEISWPDSSESFSQSSQELTVYLSDGNHKRFKVFYPASRHK